VNKLITGISLALSLCLGQAANAYVIKSGSFAGTDVGGLDTLLGQTGDLSNSSPTTETNWANSLLDPDTVFTWKTEDVDYFATLESSSVFAFQLQQQPGHFLIKNAKWWALFENTGNADWAVVDLSLLNAKAKLPDLSKLTISHVTEFGQFTSADLPPEDPVTDVSEPGGLLLIALGLLGLGLSRKRYRKA
jgi:hypothetical protein